MKKKFVEDVRERLSEKDLRLTRQREAILDILTREKDRHLTADDIYMATKGKYPDIGLATIYRTLELFEELGVVHKFEFGDGISRYEFNLQRVRHYHHHLICLGCGAVIEFDNDLLDELEDTIARESNFKVTDHCLRFFGYCEACKDKAPFST